MSSYAGAILPSLEEENMQEKHLRDPWQVLTEMLAKLMIFIIVHYKQGKMPYIWWKSFKHVSLASGSSEPAMY